MPAGVVRVTGPHGRFAGWALWSPASEISLRLLDADPDARIDGSWWHRRIAAAASRRTVLASDTNACRLVHGEGDALPSLIVDRYDEWLVLQSLSAGLEAIRQDVLAALDEIFHPRGILARNDAAVRDREGLPRRIDVLAGEVPETIEVREHGVRYLAAPHTGQKTGAFLDQRENRVIAGAAARGRALDCFAYHGSFALHLARGATRVTAVDASGAALARARANAELNGTTNIDFAESDVFDFLRAREANGETFETIVLDPPAFAKSRSTVTAALRGYREINLRALRLLTRGGILFTASCSYHVGRSEFLSMLRDAARDAGKRVILRAVTGQPLDHPEVLTIPETGYLKGALLAVDSQ
jgi:23S rRNA (cytosine1962-C5)-methyltransferase